jgi:protein-disulfide isomerase
MVIRMWAGRTGATSILTRVVGLLTVAFCALLLQGAPMAPGQAAEIPAAQNRVDFVRLTAGDNDAADPMFDELTLGDTRAPVTVIAYVSMTCLPCAHFWETSFPQLNRRYIETGKVRFVFRDSPEDELAAAASMLVRCSGPDQYFQTIGTLFARQREWIVPQPRGPLLRIASQSGLTEAAFDACLADRRWAVWVAQRHANLVAKLGPTPPMLTFIINGKPVSGDISTSDMEQLFAPYLKKRPPRRSRILGAPRRFSPLTAKRRTAPLRSANP